MSNSSISTTHKTWLKSLQDKPAKFVHWEPYVNPTMEVLNTPALIRVAKAVWRHGDRGQHLVDSLSAATISYWGAIW